MAKYLTQAMLVLTDDHPDTRAALGAAQRCSPHTVALVAKKGTPVPDVKDVVPAGRGGLNIDALFKHAADSLIPWIAIRRSLAPPAEMLSQVLMATGKHSNKAIPGFVVLFSGKRDRPVERVLAVVDRSDESLSGMMVLAAVAVAGWTDAQLDVLMLGAPGETLVAEKARESLRVTRNKEMFDRAKRMADDLPGTANWIVIDHVADPTSVVLDQVRQGNYDLVIDDLGALKLGGRMGRSGRLRHVFDNGARGQTPLALLADTDLPVMLVLDAVQLGLIPPVVIKGGVGAVLALGIATAAAPVSSARTSGDSSTSSISQQVDQTQHELSTILNPTPAAEVAPAAQAAAEDAANAEQVSAAEDGSDEAEDDQAAAEKEEEEGEPSVEDFQSAQQTEAEAEDQLADAEQDLEKAVEDVEESTEAVEDTVDDAAEMDAELAAAEAAHQEAVAHAEELEKQASGVSGIVGAPTDEELAAAEAEVANTAAALAEVEQEAARTVDEYGVTVTEAADAHDEVLEAAEEAEDASTEYEAASETASELEEELGDVRISPIAEGQYSESAHYGDAGSAWSTGHHTGEDYAAPTGTTVVAAASGTVVYAGYDDAYGNRVVIEHEDGYYTTYNHLSAITVTVGEEVTVGEKIGEVGDTGNSFGSHLHFEVTVGGDGWSSGSFVDPDDWLAGDI